MIKWENEKDILSQLIINEKLSYEEIGRRYGCTGANIKKVAKRLGISLPQRRLINPSETFNKKEAKKCLNCGKEIKRNQIYCSHTCQQEYYYKEWISKWKAGEKTGVSGQYGTSAYLRRYLFEKYDNKCAKCGWNEINPYTQNIPLEIEHIDGNFENNSEDNLILLCPNCHSLTSTYKGANKGNGRKDRKKYYVS